MIGKDTISSSSPDGEVAPMASSRVISRNGRDWRTLMGITLACEGWIIVCLSNLTPKPSWGGISSVTDRRNDLPAR